MRVSVVLSARRAALMKMGCFYPSVMNVFMIGGGDNGKVSDGMQ